MKNPTYIQISVPQPCSEDWEQMTQKEQGRFCDSCQKCVIDFTQYSDEQLLDYFAKYGNNNLCGRFANTQINRKIFKPPTRRRYFQWIMSLGFVVFLTNLFGVEAKAQEPVQKEWKHNDTKTLGEPLKEHCEQDTTKTTKELEKMPTRSTTSVVGTTAGGVGYSDGGGVSIGGARSNGTLYIVDGVQVIGGRGINISQGVIDKKQVIQSGVPAKYANKNLDR